jgi:hypothetical protein
MAWSNDMSDLIRSLERIGADSSLRHLNSSARAVVPVDSDRAGDGLSLISVAGVLDPAMDQGKLYCMVFPVNPDEPKREDEPEREKDDEPTDGESPGKTH